MPRSQGQVWLWFRREASRRRCRRPNASAAISVQSQLSIYALRGRPERLLAKLGQRRTRWSVRSVSRRSHRRAPARDAWYTKRFLSVLCRQRRPDTAPVVDAMRTSCEQAERRVPTAGTLLPPIVADVAGQGSRRVAANAGRQADWSGCNADEFVALAARHVLLLSSERGVPAKCAVHPARGDELVRSDCFMAVLRT